MIKKKKKHGQDKPNENLSERNDDLQQWCIEIRRATEGFAADLSVRIQDSDSYSGYLSIHILYTGLQKILFACHGRLKCKTHVVLHIKGKKRQVHEAMK